MAHGDISSSKGKSKNTLQFFTKTTKMGAVIKQHLKTKTNKRQITNHNNRTRTKKT